MSEIKFREYHNAGYKVFGLYGIDENGVCGCKDPECEALFKHPRIPSWQTIPLWSEEQLHAQETSMGHFVKGFGVLCDDIFVIDVDARNGGLDSFYQLQDDLDIDLEEACNFIVNTGSQDGSMHLYFKAPVPAVALQQTHAKYEGIDFKSSGFVVGLGSTHRSGKTYTLKKGSIDELGEIPQAIIDILKKVAHTRTKYEGETIDVSDQELHDIVMHIENNGCSYEKWIAVGMAIHDTTMGSNAGYDIWLSWSSQSTKHDDGLMVKKWDSFGKNSSKATIGTLYHYAKQDGGYVFPVRYDKIIMQDQPEIDTSGINTEHIDIKRPPGFVGELVQMINDRCRYPRENLAVAAALLIMSATGGTRFMDDSGITGNMIIIGTAGSGSGKETIISSITNILREVGVHRAVHGKFKSDKEFLSNLIEHQFSIYNIDEVGEELTRVANAKNRGGATYLEGLFGSIMSVYSKATDTYLVSGDQKREMQAIIDNKIRAVNQKAEKGQLSDDKAQLLIGQLNEDRKASENGIVEPYLTMFGATTPITFDNLVTYEMATNGFIARAALFKEEETNPRRKENFKPKRFDPHIINTLRALYNGGNVSIGDDYQKLKRKTDWVTIETTDSGNKALDEIYEYFHEWAESSKNNNGLEAIPRRGWEIVSKISLLLSLAEGVRTKEHILYAFASAKKDIKNKIELAKSNDKIDDDKEVHNAIAARILSYLPEKNDEPVTIGSVANRIRVKGVTRDNIDAIIEQLKQKGIISVEDKEYGRGGRKTLFLRKL